MISSILSNMQFIKDYALRLTKNDHDAEDLIQDAIEKILKTGDRYESLQENQKRMVFSTTLRNAFYDTERRKKIKISTNNTESLHIPYFQPDNIDFGTLKKKVQESGNKNIELFLLNIAGYEAKEIAKMKDMHPAAAKAAIYRGRDALRGIINGENSKRRRRLTIQQKLDKYLKFFAVEKL